MKVMMTKTQTVSLFLLAMLAAGSSPVAAQQSTALGNHNTGAPVNVAADRIEVQDRADRAVFSGNVVATQADLTLNAARVTLAYANVSGIQIKRIDASGGVTVRSPAETAKGSYAIYDLESRLITLIGGVTLTRGASNVSGGRLVIDLTTGRAVMDGGAGRGATSTSGGRVTGTFSVPERAQPPAGKAPGN